MKCRDDLFAWAASPLLCVTDLSSDAPFFKNNNRLHAMARDSLFTFNRSGVPSPTLPVALLLFPVPKVILLFSASGCVCVPPPQILVF